LLKDEEFDMRLEFEKYRRLKPKIVVDKRSGKLSMKASDLDTSEENL
jgi:hypothetical protein